MRLGLVPFRSMHVPRHVRERKKKVDSSYLLEMDVSTTSAYMLVDVNLHVMERVLLALATPHCSPYA